jgi:drug/metabolite transporter (DMT)-like permease
MLNDQIIGAAAALGSAASWALGSVLFKMLGDKLEPVALTFAKGLLGVLMLGGALLFLGFQPVRFDSILLLTLSGLLGIAIGDTFFLPRCEV